jgi:hypothetical protein
MGPLLVESTNPAVSPGGVKFDVNEKSAGGGVVPSRRRLTI